MNLQDRAPISPMAMAADAFAAAPAPAPAQVMGTSRAAYLATGGVRNRFVEAKVRFDNQRRQRSARDQFARLMQEGRAGMQKIYDDAVALYGEQAKGYLPPIEAFRDPKTGMYDALKYSTHALTGILHLEKKLETENKGKAEQEAAAKKEAEATSGADALRGITLPPGASREQAYAAMAMDPNAIKAPKDVREAWTGGFRPQSDIERSSAESNKPPAQPSLANDPQAKFESQLDRLYGDQAALDTQIKGIGKQIAVMEEEESALQSEEVVSLRAQKARLEGDLRDKRREIESTKKARELAVQRGNTPYNALTREGEAVATRERVETAYQKTSPSMFLYGEGKPELSEAENAKIKARHLGQPDPTTDPAAGTTGSSSFTPEEQSAIESRARLILLKSGISNPTPEQLRTQMNFIASQL